MLISYFLVEENGGRGIFLFHEMRNQIKELTQIANALSDPNRIRLLAACLDTERCVCQLVELIELSNASISKHLSALKQAGLLASRKDGRWVHYATPESPSPAAVSGLRFVRDHALHDETITADKAKLKQIDQIEPAELAKSQRTGCCINWICCKPRSKGAKS